MNISTAWSWIYVCYYYDGKLNIPPVTVLNVVNGPVLRVTPVPAEGAVVQWREPAGEWEALWRGQSQKCTEDDAEGRTSLSW